MVKVKSIQKPCRNCNGQGRIRVKREIKLKIDKGVQNGFEYRLQGQGEAGASGGPPGDLLRLHYTLHHMIGLNATETI